MPDQRPVIKGDNPPPDKLAVSNAYLAKKYELDHSTFALFHIGVACVGLVVVIATHSTMLVILTIALAAYLLKELILKPSNNYGVLAAENARPVTLEVYPMEFFCPLANNTIQLITVQFGLPRDQMSLQAQLDHVAEGILIPFTRKSSTPIPDKEIEDLLRRELVRFQDENLIPVLRAKVLLTIHRTPDKKKTVDV